jgi:hypothetical protein
VGGQKMIDELNAAIADYQTKWQKLLKGRADKGFFDSLKPKALGWKVTDRAAYDKMCSELHDQADMIVEKWMNERWIAKVHLKDTKLSGGIEIIKVMERRPGSTDVIGLDHLDFYSPNVAKGEEVLAKEPSLKWSREENDTMENYNWLSIWFDGTEAKLKTDTVVDVVIAELAVLSKQVKANRA